MMKIRATARIFSCSGRHAKISLKFTDKAFVFEDLSVIKTHFTDKPSFSGDLSVNFWPLWWGFTDRRLFLERLSVKPGPKRLNFYGQTVIFTHFVRNRHFSSRLITDSMPIFIDVFGNDSDFAKCSAAHHLFNRCTWLRLRSKRWFLRFARNLRPKCFVEDNRVEHFLNFSRFCSTFGVAQTDFGVIGRQKSHIFPGFCLLSGPRTPIFESAVDKNHTFTPVFVYFQVCASRFLSRR